MSVPTQRWVRDVCSRGLDKVISPWMCNIPSLHSMGVLNQSLQTQLPSGRCCSQLASQFRRWRVNQFRTWVQLSTLTQHYSLIPSLSVRDTNDASLLSTNQITLKAARSLNLSVQFGKLAWSCQECGNQTDTVGCALADQSHKHALMAQTREASTKREYSVPYLCFLQYCTLPPSPLLACFFIW